MTCRAGPSPWAAQGPGERVPGSAGRALGDGASAARSSDQSQSPLLGEKLPAEGGPTPLTAFHPQVAQASTLRSRTVSCKVSGSNDRVHVPFLK